MDISVEFLNGVFDCRDLLNLYLVLKFAKNAEPRLSMVQLQNASGGGLSINRLDELMVLAIRDSGDWGGDHNRSIRVHLSGAASINPLERFAHMLESITLDADHDLKALQTGRQKTREEAYKSIIRHWLTHSLRSTVRSWGLTIEHMLVEQSGGFHMVEIALRHDDAVVATYRLDGWSGMMSVNSVWIRDRRPSPQSFRERVEGDIIEYLDRATSTVLTA